MLCDIVEMNNCHIFLGRPWQYDCIAMYDCVKNMFTVEKNNRKLSLMPLLDTTLGRRNLSFGSQDELRNSKMMDQY